MNGSAEFVRRWLAEWDGERGDIPAAVSAAVFPPFPYLPMLADGESRGFALGGQDCSAAESGARTGEVSAEMLAEAGCKFTLVGHSERRRFWGEDGKICGAKLRAATAAGLTPILCVGETAEERARGQTEKVVRTQLGAALEGFQSFQSARTGGGGGGGGDGVDGKGGVGVGVVVGYEPVWAIGAGRVPGAGEISRAHRAARDFLAEMKFDGGGCDIIRIIYGGSVAASNAAEIFAAEGVDGALVGGASLRASDFARICRAAGTRI